MNFLAPLFLLGAAAVALPFLFHLIRRTTRVKKQFSSLMFLTPTPPRLTRRSRLEHILLLLLRCAVLCLLALGFARPFFQNAQVITPPSSGSKRTLILLDRSASMQREGLWRSATDATMTAIRKARPSDEIALYVFSRGVTPIVGFEEWTTAAVSERAALAESRLAQTSPTWEATRTGDALMRAAELLSDRVGSVHVEAEKEILLVTDLQEGSRLDDIQGYEWPRGMTLSVETVKATRANNASIQLLNFVSETETNEASGASIRVSNAPDSRAEQFRVGWAGANDQVAGVMKDFHLPAGQSRSLQLARMETSGNADHPARVVLRGDDVPFDNTVYIMPPTPLKLEVLYIGQEKESEVRQPLFFLRRAVQETRERVVQLVSKMPAEAISERQVTNASLIILAAAVNETVSDLVKQHVNEGGTLLALVRDPAIAEPLARILGVPRITIEESEASSYSILSEIDYRHPLFVPFADPRFADFTKIRFWSHRRLNLDGLAEARAIAKFDNGDPAIVEAAVGRGRVILFASGWHPADSQLGLSTKFVPMLYTLFEQSAGRGPAMPQFLVGDQVAVDAIVGGRFDSGKLWAPDGSVSEIDPGKSAMSSVPTPGIYSVVAANSTNRFAVNLDPMESRLAPLALEELERLGVPLANTDERAKHRVAAKIERLRSAELENRQKLWRWIIVATLGVLIIETWLSGRTARRIVVPAQS